MTKYWRYPTFEEYLETVDNVELFGPDNLNRVFNIAYSWGENEFLSLLNRAIEHKLCTFETLLNLYQYFDHQKINKSQYVKFIINYYNIPKLINIEKTKNELTVKYNSLIISKFELKLAHYQNLLSEILNEILFFCDLVEDDILTSDDLKHIINTYVNIFQNIETLTSILT